MFVDFVYLFRFGLVSIFVNLFVVVSVVALLSPLGLLVCLLLFFVCLLLKIAYVCECMRALLFARIWILHMAKVT